MQGNRISTERTIHKYCSVQFVPHDSHGEDQLEIPLEQSYNVV